MSYGSKSHVAICFQNSWDTVNTSSLHHLQHLEESIGLNIPPLIDESARGVFDEGDGYGGARTVDGDLSINAKSIPLGVFLKAMFGDPTTVTSNTMYTHTFKPRTADFDRYSAGNPITLLKHLDDAGSAHLFYNLNATTLELGCTNGEFMTARCSFVGGSFQQIADIAASYPTGKRFTWDSSSLQIAGAGNADFRNLTITVNENIEAMHTINGTAYPSRCKRTAQRTVEVSGTYVFDNQVEYQKFLDQSEQELVVSFDGPTEIASGYTDQIVVTLPALRYTELKPVAGNTGKIEVSVTGSGKYLTTSATAMQIDLRNLQAGY